MNRKALNVLFVCAGDCTRAVMAQALLNRFGAGRFSAFSAGGAARAPIDPLALETLHHHGLDAAEPGGRHFTEFLGSAAPRLDYVIFLSDGVEIPGDWPPAALRAVWRIADPAAQAGDLAQRRLAMRRAMRELENRIKLFALLRHDAGGALHPA